MATHDLLHPAQIQRGLRINMAAGALGMCWVALAFTLPLTMFLEALGASGPQIGLAATLQQLAMAVQIPAALWVERLSRRKPFWAAVTIPHRLLWALPAILILTPGMETTTVIWITLLMVGVSGVLMHASVPVWFAWMADLVPRESSGRFWGTRQSCTTAAFVVAMGAAGWLLDRHRGGLGGFAVCFGLGAALGTADILLHLGVPEPTPHAHPSATPLRVRLLAPWRNPDFRWLTLAMGAWFLANGIHASFSPVYLKREFGVDYRYLVLLPIMGSVSTILTGVPMGRLIDRLGGRGLAMLLLAAGPLCGLFWFFLTPGQVGLAGLTLPRPIAVMVVGHLMAGGLYAGVALCQIHLVNSVTGREGRTLAMAMHWSAVGAMAALGPVFGGWFMDLWTRHGWRFALPGGGAFTFYQGLVALHMLLAWGLAIPLLARVHVRSGAVPLRLVLAGLRAGNPFRAVLPPNTGYLDTTANGRRAKEAKPDVPT